MTVNEKLCKNIALKLQVTYVLEYLFTSLATNDVVVMSVLCTLTKHHTVCISPDTGSIEIDIFFISQKKKKKKKKKKIQKTYAVGIH